MDIIQILLVVPVIPFFSRIATLHSVVMPPQSSSSKVVPQSFCLFSLTLVCLMSIGLLFGECTFIWVCRMCVRGSIQTSCFCREHRRLCRALLGPVSAYVLLPCVSNGDANFDLLLKVVSALCLPHKVTVFPFGISKCLVERHE